jgi:type II restriction enzyme
MNLSLPAEGLANYKSASQRARISSESWAARELYCPRCAANRLVQLPPGTPVFDFRCPRCTSAFQLKSCASAFGNRVVDGAHAKMRTAILNGEAPNFLLLHYHLLSFAVFSLIFIPDFAMTLSALECRKPLSSTARRAGWIGCNILLTHIPKDARIALVWNREAVAPQKVRSAFKRLEPLASLQAEKRGWTLDVLNAVRSLKKSEFTLSEVYAFEDSLARLHPNNANIQPKIRQQLQVLRDLGLLTFLGNGSYRLG